MARKSYVGGDVTVSFDPEVCQHSGNCARGCPPCSTLTGSRG